MTGSLTIVGIGPGRRDLVTPAARTAIERASDLVGYGTYLSRVPVTEGQVRHASDNRVELERARHALTLAAAGRQVAVVSGGDPGVFAMAAAVFEAIETGPAAWRGLDITVEPGVTAMLAAAAAAGGPLGADFCAISLSDNLKSWATVQRRLEAAARGDFVIALYNSRSKARPDRLGEAFALLRDCAGPERIVLMVRAAGDVGTVVQQATLGTVDATLADMRTLVIVGSSATRRLERPSGPAWIYTPRGEETPR